MRLSRLCALLLVCPAVASQFPPAVTANDVPRLLAGTAFVRSLDEAALRRWVPTRSGLFFVGCPNCKGGRQENQLDWNPERPGEVYCRYCSQRYPSPKYPASASLTVRNPRGEVQHYPYWADASGYRYFFEARRENLVRLHLAGATRDLALLYVATGDRAYAARAALLLDQFARVFPGWCYHFDIPFHQKEIYDGAVPPEKFRPGFRTARWTYWAYRDIPSVLVEAYDWIRSSGALSAESAARIERDLFRNAADQVLGNPETYHNMSPAAWTALITLGRVIGEPRYVQEPLRRLRHFLAAQFLYDHAWHEGAPSYHGQITLELSRVFDALRGDSAPDDLAALEATVTLSNRVLLQMRLPDGRAVPVHDTWSTERRPAPAASTPWLLPALGHACLGSGSGAAQQQYHLTWSGGYGHQHADNLSLLLHARGRELLSDLGYSHTRYRPWTLASVAHNTVVVDGINQFAGSPSRPSDGTLRYFDAAGPGVRVVSASGERAYPALAGLYRRTLVSIDGAYTVDIFEVEGGSTHDYFLHGDADRSSAVSAPLPFEPLATLLPAGFSWREPRSESDDAGLSRPWYAYGFLDRLRAAPVPAGAPLAVTFPNLRVTLLPEAASRLVLGRNPSVRQSADDEATLGSFSRPFLMLRHHGPGSVFLAVLEPFETAPAAVSVERLSLSGATAALRVCRGSRTDTLIYGAQAPVKVPAGSQAATFTGEVGVLSMEGDRVVRAYALGPGGWRRGAVSLSASMGRATLAGLEAGRLLLRAVTGSLPQPGAVVRLVTSDGWVYPFTVTASEPAAGGAARIAVSESPALTLTNGNLSLTAYPQRAHRGGATVDWQLPARTDGDPFR